ncbi:MAG TPA: DUF4349 domain-containing protein [Frankiaceae bacterium]|nr:DUF4349 domain-containing protein [Frankiaceae bacterium]
MIDEAVLERLLREEADTYVPPPDGPDDILLLAAEAADARPPRAKWFAGAAAAAAIVAIAVAVPRLPGSTTYSDTASEQYGGGTAVALNDDSATTRGWSEYDAGGKGELAYKNADGTHVVRTGEVWLTTPRDRVGPALRDVARLAAAHGGFVAESNAETASEQPSGFVTVRVPVASFDKTVDEVERLGEVRRSSSDGKDVGTEVADTKARLKSLTATRAQLRALLADATNVGEVLAVQERITETQTEIEKLQATQASLTDRTTYGTLRVMVSVPGSEEPPDGGFSGAWEDAKNGFAGGFEALVRASGTIAFLLVAGGVLLVLARRAYRYWVRGAV